jgi:dipeptidyl aminopeptidase/acylaminoacyl peptidase
VVRLGITACLVALLVPAAASSATRAVSTRFAIVAVSSGKTSDVGIAPAGAAIAPDRLHYAFARHNLTAPYRWTLVVASFLGGPETVVATLRYEIDAPVWSPTGDRLLYRGWNVDPCNPPGTMILCATAELWVVGSAGGDSRMLASFASDPKWSPDGRRVAYLGEYNTYDASSGRTGKPYVVDADGSEVRRLATLRGVKRLSWAPDSKRIAVSAYAGFVAVVPVGGGPYRKIRNTGFAVWSPRGDSIAGVHGSSIVVARPDGHVLRTIPATSMRGSLVWSPDGQRLAYLTVPSARDAYSAAQLVVRPAAGGAARVVARVAWKNEVRLLGWLRDGAILYSTF